MLFSCTVQKAGGRVLELERQYMSQLEQRSESHDFSELDKPPQLPLNPIRAAAVWYLWKLGH